MIRTVEEWFTTLQKEGDLMVARQLMVDMGITQRHATYREDVERLLNLITAIRLDQLSKAE